MPCYWSKRTGRLPTADANLQPATSNLQIATCNLSIPAHKFLPAG
jgi:hypothetical protein